MRMARPTSEAVEGGEQLRRALEEWGEPGAAELGEVVQELLAGADGGHGPLRLERLKQEVYRLRIGGPPGDTLVLKRLKPATAQTDRLVAERWLPALGLGDRCPRLLAAAAARDGCWVWHVYEDLGQDNLAGQRQPE